MIARRGGLPRDVAVDASVAICQRMLRLSEVRAASTVLAYWPMTDRGEVDIRPFLDALMEAGVRVGLPIIRPRDAERRLDFGPYLLDVPLLPGPFGTMQPAPTEGFDWRSAEVVVVPALAATRAGDRLGYGGGYYDRFLAGSRAVSVLPIFSACLLDSLPVEEHDMPVDIVVTEQQEIRSRRSA